MKSIYNNPIFQKDMEQYSFKLYYLKIYNQFYKNIKSLKKNILFYIKDINFSLYQISLLLIKLFY